MNNRNQKYYRRNYIYIFYYDLINFVAKKINLTLGAKRQLPEKIRKILIINPAHLGDLLISTAVIKNLHKKLPNCQIDVICASWSKAVIENNENIRYIYSLDFPSLNRGVRNIFFRYGKFINSVINLFKLIPRNEYDCVFVVYSFSPSAIPIARALVNAPIVGFSSAGYEFLLSESINPFDYDDLHEVQYQSLLFTKWLGAYDKKSDFQPCLNDNLSSELPVFLKDLDYIVFHPCSGNPKKEWLPLNWTDCVEYAIEKNLKVVVTGLGSREANINSAITKNLDVINLTDQINFSEFCVIIKNAKLLVSVDSVACHIASAYEVPSIIIYSGISNISRWKPLNKNIHTISTNMHCSPCLTKPCTLRPCITGISVNEVKNSIVKMSNHENIF